MTQICIHLHQEPAITDKYTMYRGDCRIRIWTYNPRHNNGEVTNCSTWSHFRSSSSRPGIPFPMAARWDERMTNTDGEHIKWVIWVVWPWHTHIIVSAAAAFRGLLLSFLSNRLPSMTHRLVRPGEADFTVLACHCAVVGKSGSVCSAFWGLTASRQPVCVHVVRLCRLSRLENPRERQRESKHYKNG